VAATDDDVITTVDKVNGDAVVANEDTNGYFKASTLIKYEMSTPFDRPSKFGSIAASC
jgi:hypothetical protein